MDDNATLNSEALSNLRRRNSIATSITVPTPATKSCHSSSSFLQQNGHASPPLPPSPLNLELLSLKSSTTSSLTYTSLRDILLSPATINSPTAASAANSGYEISIRNRLVKQAAWAYLQPMSSSPDSSESQFLRRIWFSLLGRNQNPFSSCVGFIRCSVIPAITEVFDRIIRAIRLCLGR